MGDYHVEMLAVFVEALQAEQCLFPGKHSLRNLGETAELFICVPATVLASTPIILRAYGSLFPGRSQ